MEHSLPDSEKKVVEMAQEVRTEQSCLQSTFGDELKSLHLE